jgi:asparagine synthase (glutamine-hydrolysing)
MLERMSRVDLQTYLQELLMKQDQMSMASSIESRVPFLDDRLVEHVAAMPGRLKLRGWTTKAVLRAAVRDLVPPAILARRKMGFLCQSPLRHGGGRGLFSDRVRNLAGSIRNPAALADEHRARVRPTIVWLLINLEIWRDFCGETSADVLRAIARSHQDVLASSG